MFFYGRLLMDPSNFHGSFPDLPSSKTPMPTAPTVERREEFCALDLRKIPQNKIEIASLAIQTASKLQTIAQMHGVTFDERLAHVPELEAAITLISGFHSWQTGKMEADFQAMGQAEGSPEQMAKIFGTLVKLERTSQEMIKWVAGSGYQDDLIGPLLAGTTSSFRLYDTAEKTRLVAQAFWKGEFSAEVLINVSAYTADILSFFALAIGRTEIGTLLKVYSTVVNLARLLWGKPEPFSSELIAAKQNSLQQQWKAFVAKEAQIMTGWEHDAELSEYHQNIAELRMQLERGPSLDDPSTIFLLKRYQCLVDKIKRLPSGLEAWHSEERLGELLGTVADFSLRLDKGKELLKQALQDSMVQLQEALRSLEKAGAELLEGTKQVSGGAVVQKRYLRPELAAEYDFIHQHLEVFLNTEQMLVDSVSSPHQPESFEMRSLWLRKAEALTSPAGREQAFRPFSRSILNTAYLRTIDVRVKRD